MSKKTIEIFKNLLEAKREKQMKTNKKNELRNVVTIVVALSTLLVSSFAFAGDKTSSVDWINVDSSGFVVFRLTDQPGEGEMEASCATTNYGFALPSTDVQKSYLSLLTAAQLSGKKVRVIWSSASECDRSGYGGNRYVIPKGMRLMK